jgi:hypothetical protein
MTELWMSLGLGTLVMQENKIKDSCDVNATAKTSSTRGVEELLNKLLSLMSKVDEYSNINVTLINTKVKMD